MKRSFVCAIVVFSIILSSFFACAFADTSSPGFADIMQEMKKFYDENGSHFEFKANDTCAYIEMSSATYMKYCKDYETWDELRASFIDLGKMFAAMMPFMEDCGEDLLMVLVAEENNDVIMLVLYNGEVVYDFFPSVTYY